MKILQVTKWYAPIIGGIETAVQNIAEGLENKRLNLSSPRANGSPDPRSPQRSDLGIQNEVLVCQKKWKASVDEVHGVRVYRAGIIGMVMRMPISFGFFRLFRERVKECDAVFLHHPFPLSFLAYWLYGKGKPLFVWYHSDIVRQRISGFLIRPLIFAVLYRAKKIFVSNNNLVKYSTILQKFKEKCVVIPFGVDVSKFKETDAVKKEAAEIRSRYGTPIILSVGRLVYYKGFEYLIRAMQGINAKLLIVGDGPLEESLMNLSRKLGIQENIIFVPYVPSLVPYYHACDFFVLSSCEASEAFGIVQLEAMACGKPVINTNLPTGVPEVSVDGETGITVPSKDSHTLHDAILKLIGDQRLCERFGMRARRRVEEHFRLEKFIDVLATEIEALSGKRA